jgi:hypothetical protein
MMSCASAPMQMFLYCCSLLLLLLLLLQMFL